MSDKDKNEDILGRQYNLKNKQGGLGINIEFPIDREIKINYEIREEGKRNHLKDILKKFLKVEGRQKSFRPKKYGIISESEEIKKIDGKHYYILNASFYNKRKVESINVKIDLTELKELGADLDRIKSMIIVTDKRGRVLYLPPQFDKNVKDWAKREGIKNYKLRSDIIGKYKITSYIKNKEKRVMKKILKDVIKKGMTMVRETNVSPKKFQLLQCKSKNMTHVINVFHAEGDLMFQFSVNVSDISQKLWEEFEKRNSNLIENRKIINIGEKAEKIMYLNGEAEETYIAFLNFLENFLKTKGIKITEKLHIINPFVIGIPNGQEEEGVFENENREDNEEGFLHEYKLKGEHFHDISNGLDSNKELMKLVKDNRISPVVDKVIYEYNTSEINSVGLEPLPYSKNPVIGMVEETIENMRELEVEESVINEVKKDILGLISYLKEGEGMEKIKIIKNAIDNTIYDENFLELDVNEKINKLKNTIKKTISLYNDEKIDGVINNILKKEPVVILRQHQTETEEEIKETVNNLSYESSTRKISMERIEYNTLKEEIHEIINVKYLVKERLKQFIGNNEEVNIKTNINEYPQREILENAVETIVLENIENLYDKEERKNLIIKTANILSKLYSLKLERSKEEVFENYSKKIAKIIKIDKNAALNLLEKLNRMEAKEVKRKIELIIKLDNIIKEEFKHKLFEILESMESCETTRRFVENL